MDRGPGGGTGDVYGAGHRIRLLGGEARHASSDKPPSLTRREKEVALLVTRGLTNRQISSKLVLSEHTVHHHVTNILKRLNLTSRQQVASHLHHR